MAAGGDGSYFTPLTVDDPALDFKQLNCERLQVEAPETIQAFDDTAAYYYSGKAPESTKA